MLGRFVIMCIPLFLSFAFSDFPETSFYTAWLGSFWIFLLTLSGFVKKLPSDLSLLEQAVRPIFLTHIVFAAYMASTSIFYFLDLNGYYFLDKDPYAILDQKELALAAQCQRYYLLGHTFYVLGILSFMNYDFEPKYRIMVDSVSAFTLRLSIYFSVIAFLVRFIPGLDQIEAVVFDLSLVASSMSLSYAIPENKKTAIFISGFLFASNYLNAVVSGWKEAMLIPLILLGVFLYPHYKKMVLISFPFILAVFFYIVPSFNQTFRRLAWSGNVDAAEAAQIAFAEITSGDDLEDDNWEFLVNRISEIGMFKTYVDVIPRQIDFYYFKILNQAFLNLVPRIFYPEKPNTEKIVMERVYEAGITSELSNVSAKPPPIVDGYISGGFWGIIITCFFIGSFSSWISVQAEKLFGSYLIGSGLICTGLFQVLWRGNCFEFLLNNMFWGYLIMIVLFKAGQSLKMIHRIE